jgi:peroxiredoxin
MVGRDSSRPILLTSRKPRPCLGGRYNAAMPVINQPAPDFALPDLDGHLQRLSALRGKIIVVNFWSAECGWSEQSDLEIREYSEAYPGRVVTLRVAANANEADEMLKDVSRARGLDIILKDSSAKVADLYAAQTTPQLFVVDEGGLLRYQGAPTDKTFRQRTATRFYLKEALEALLAGRLPEVAETLPYGCAIVRET